MLHFELVLTQFQDVIGFINIGSQTKNKNGKKKDSLDFEERLSFEFQLSNKRLG